MRKLLDFYESTQGEWIALACQTNYEEMIQVEAEHNQESAIPLSGEQMSVKVPKKRSGYVKALGLRPSSSSRTTSESATIHECVMPRDEVKRHKMRP
ncbi:hypothetical protein RHGRI_026338 [Rhododendron griersonianum]|uniref:Uncharacterized protein n=1 Tax=Rhododendron griersonianum TaxID=479676 RepID=A0AAV6ITC3_9ERIC|nr:hypothetical protein RHGRI_026338 [Rhododendron griersonianum]